MTDDTRLHERVGTLETKVSDLEWTTRDHSRMIKDNEKNTELLVAELGGIQKTLIQIKYFAMGATALYLADSVGITNLLKAVL